ncbi:unnamed protein product [Chondrus crispus]|uniref:Uncharacterized protein n=1 Tax=Chondrus crispus TaxID=2769 RepID=R7Q6J5_CHOCR|nr:unnamed protein product [Chondrus crispus]CDF33085.1 unnamed protein product [Chondrus crispus]|eukprot:XP_005712888.1 unnamed protein product [Chondrus crispus]
MMLHPLLLSLLLGVALAHTSTPILPESKVNYDLFPVTSRQQRGCARAPFKSSVSGFIRASTFGVSVTRGATATISFSITLSGISAVEMAKKDAIYQNILTGSLKKTYMRRKNAYKGGLNLPFMADIGADLRRRKLNGGELRKSRVSKQLFERRLCAVSKILGGVRRARVQIRGSRRVTGTSLIPRTVYGYVKVARVTRTDGKTITIVSTDPRDFVVSTSEGIVSARGVEGVQVSQL